MEVLRGVVEEGLKERREGVLVGGGHNDEDEDDIDADKTQHHLAQSTGSSASSRSPSSSRAPSPLASRPPARRPTRGNRLQESTNGPAPPFIDIHEITRITEELEERRSERSLTTSSRSSRAPSRQSNNDSEDLSRSSSSSHSGDDREVARMTRRAAPGKVVQSEAGPSTLPTQRVGSLRDRDTKTTRKPSRTAPAPRDRAREHDRQQDTDLPRVRGAHLEQLFYAAPPHDPRTCTVCHNPANQGHKRGSDDEPIPGWLRNAVKAKRRTRDGEVDEGFDENSDEFQRDVRADGDELPPQTVLVKVLKELEDDFTHYKL